MNNEWSKEWIKEIKIGTTGFEPYPLQFANVERIEGNDAVYIFDETGSGKTISSGLMALHYLYNNPDKDVLVLTVPTLKRSGQFINDWIGKLPFKELNLQGRITVENNVFSNIRKLKTNWGLIVIDEAHGYLEAKNRKEAVLNLRSDKVIFMTATPIKRGEYNLEDYIILAQEILQKEVDSSWPDKLPDKLIPNKKGLPICASFDESLPVTRYFKDTVKALEYVENGIDFEKTKAVRKIPEIWDYEPENLDYEPKKKIQRLVDKIKRIRRTEDADNADNTDNTDPSMRSRFIVFTKLIKKEQDPIEKYLENDDSFTQYTGEQNDKLTYICVNGNSESQIEKFSSNGLGDKVLPDVLIITYQIAEAGVNLPGYNYVINYHIPGYPSAIEQRFGRIDRMGNSNGTRYDEINMVFLLSDRLFDTNKMNYYQAISIYLNELLTKLPSKNTLLSKEILSYYFDDIENLQGEINEYENQLNTILKIADDLSEGQNGSETFDPQSIPEQNLKRLEEFCLENDIPLYENASENKQGVETFSSIIDEIQDRIEEVKGKLRELSKMNKDDYGKYKDFLNSIKDKIFYYSSDGLQTLYAIKKEKNDKIGENNEVGEKVESSKKEKGCAELIYESEPYKNYVRDFNDNIRDLVKLPLILEKYSDKKKYSDKIEEYFENQFLARGGRGDFEYIFLLPEEYENLFKNEIFPEDSINPEYREDRRILCKYAHNVITRLPFFKMVDRFKDAIESKRRGKKGNQLEKFEFHLPIQALRKIEDTIPGSLKEKQEIFAALEPDNGYEEWECSNWLKLFYICADPASMKFYELAKKSRLFAERLEEAGVENYEDMEAKLFGEEDRNEIVSLIRQVFYNRDCKFKDLFLGKNSGTDLFKYYLLGDTSSKFPWREKYKADDSKTWSTLVPYTSCRGGCTNDFEWPNLGLEFWTFLFFSYLDIRLNIPDIPNRHYRIDSQEPFEFGLWMFSNFLPETGITMKPKGRRIIKRIIYDTLVYIKKRKRLAGLKSVKWHKPLDRNVQSLISKYRKKRKKLWTTR